ncbi:MAG: Rv3654c family TadE-like protein [Ornithinimicrobium sp.]|uniref:Rv3654c family TadE-like protein n=1 Tax=Ornithinimicrobium sp. TaxID=1977084 RepID=UPI003D9BC0FD
MLQRPRYGTAGWSAPRRAARERGSATVLGLAVIAVVLSVWIAAVVLGAVILAGGRARTAADLAAVGGAQVLLNAAAEESGACGRVEQVARDNGADLVSCALRSPKSADQGPTIEVLVEVPTGLSAWPSVQARARAGLVAADG